MKSIPSDYNPVDEKPDLVKGDRTDTIFFTFLLLSIFGLIFLASYALGQDPGFDSTARFEDRWRKEGQFIIVQISKSNPVRIFVLGREEAKIDFSKLELTVRRAKPYPGKILKVNRYNNYYEIDDDRGLAKITDLEVTAQFKDKNETFHFNLEQNKSESK